MGDYEEAKIGSIIIVESLPESDTKTGEELYNDVVQRYIEYHHRDEMKHEFQKVSSKNQFLELISSITRSIKDYPPGVLIHLEAHGASDQSGIVFGDGSLAVWKDLQNAFITLNSELNNQLYINLATCYGRNFYLTVDFNKKAPFRAFISSSKEMTVNEILEDYGYLLEELIATGDLIKAYNKADLRGTNYYYKDARTVASESFYSLDRKLKDPDFRENFLAVTKLNWDHINDLEALPEFDSIDFDKIIEMVKLDLMNNITKNFYFDSI